MGGSRRSQRDEPSNIWRTLKAEKKDGAPKFLRGPAEVKLLRRRGDQVIDGITYRRAFHPRGGQKDSHFGGEVDP